MKQESSRTICTHLGGGQEAVPSRLRSAALFRVGLLLLRQAGSTPARLSPSTHPPFLSLAGNPAKPREPGQIPPMEQTSPERQRSPWALEAQPCHLRKSEKKAINIICLPSQIVLPLQVSDVSDYYFVLISCCCLRVFDSARKRAGLVAHPCILLGASGRGF